MRAYLIISILFLFSITLSASDTTKVFGVDKRYAGVTFYLNDASDAISGREIKVKQLVVDSAGRFEFDFKVNRTTPMRIVVDNYKLRFVAEPGKEYELLLPPVKERTVLDELNPYFQYTVIPARFSNANNKDLNSSLLGFDIDYMRIYSEYSVKIFRNRNIDDLPDKIDSLQLKYSDINSGYFKLYSKSKIALLNYKLKLNRYKEKTYDLFNNSKPDRYNEGYMTLFNEYFDEYFRNSKMIDRKPIGKILERESALDGILSEMDKVKRFKNRELKELVLIKQIYDESYQRLYAFPDLINLLQTIEKRTIADGHKQLCSSVYDLLTRVKPGYAPYKFKLKNDKGEEVTPDMYKGRYFVLIGFCNTYKGEIYNELKLLDMMYSKYARSFKVILVFRGEDRGQVREWSDVLNENWQIVYSDEDPDLLDKYMVKSYPTFYLLNREGIMLKSPTRLMSEGFENDLRSGLGRSNRRRRR